MAKFPILVTDDGDERALPYKWVICPDCDGHGKSSAYLGAFTGSQMREDPDFAEEYFAGAYDRACDGCTGSGKVPVVDARACKRADLLGYRAQQDEIADMNAMHRAERLFEGGWRELGWFGD